ncbi:GTP--adenosylcobinamide-phosphateguanylyl transferase [Halobiforma lacisalsi AJ5]|uniref:GTP--adenosylcobinamide-phosphateguanylyl transferase n=1 Tax=Natronobacterium lacisalsi AJ5 TaxID=358396 RepID=M0L9J2_NATLA|nr:GTP--adenosylcobinamide-phosphateguanylyl transferase [Halobiforma lacisalsi]APW97871.1 GTP--adenosylcobinamide-phosphateguanylyl transferase [Halobiforma lacisalsi AJ5]EMA29139.1 GTP:adenosylcobinamide-phosphateguanylyl transferase-like protein [Halobiforma lacisalsi AJ5]
MCGGKGSRLESRHEKPLHPIAGDPMIDRVVAALAESEIETIHAAVSPNAPGTRAHLEDDDCVRTVETPGDGYVADLLAALEAPVISPPILSVAADLPLLAPEVVDRVLAVHEGDGSLTVSVPVALKRRLGVGVDSRLEAAPHLAPTGANVVGDADSDSNSTSNPNTNTNSNTNSNQNDTMHVSYDPRLAVNVNRLEDARVAESLLEEGFDREVC